MTKTKDLDPATCISTTYALLPRFDHTKRKMKLPCSRLDDCPYCVPKRQKKLYGLALHGAKILPDDNMKFFTLTIPNTHDEYNTPTSLARRLTKNFRRLRKSLQNSAAEYDGTEYFCVLEFGDKHQRPHLHFLIHDPHNLFPTNKPRSAYKYTRDWFDDMSPEAQSFYLRLGNLGLGFYHCEKIAYGPGGAASYLVKYISKSVKSSKTVEKLKGIRLYNMSRGWPRKEKPLDTFAHKLEAVVDVSRSEDKSILDYADIEPVVFDPLSTTYEDIIRFQLDGQPILSRMDSFLSDVSTFVDISRDYNRVYSKYIDHNPMHRVRVPKRLREFTCTRMTKPEIRHLETEVISETNDDIARHLLFLRKSVLEQLSKIRSEYDYSGSIKFLHYIVKSDLDSDFLTKILST